jgi:hypothetical protein
MADLADRADTHVHDAIVVSGGIAGLSAGWHRGAPRAGAGRGCIATAQRMHACAPSE